METIKLAIFQFRPGQNEHAFNLQRVTDAITEAAMQGAEVFLLPELWLTGPLSQGFRFDEICKKCPEILNHLAKKTGMVIIGTIPIPAIGSPDLFYNSTYIASPFADVGEVYRKIHLFAPMQEDCYFLPGQEVRPISLTLSGNNNNKEVCVGVMTCFDLRFPEVARKLIWEGAQMLLVSALWPESRRAHFDCLLRARAIENQCFVAAVNACGNVADYVMGGGSKVIGPTGSLLYEAGAEEALSVVECGLSEVKEVRSGFQTHLPAGAWFWNSGQKLLDIDGLRRELLYRRQTGQRIVFTNGCFDLLHAGHVHYLQEARSYGDCLVVAINGDASVKALKGDPRPINNEVYRVAVLSALACVDYVIIFNEPTPLAIIEAIEPDVLVKGADWSEENIVGADVVKKRGGRILRIPFNYHLSTTAIIETILEAYKKRRYIHEDYSL